MNDFQGSALDNILAIEPITDIAPSDQMFQGNHRHYFGVGRSALLAIASAFTARTQFNNSEGHPQSILDYGCGHGRVARFIRAAFPPARLEVTDYSHDGVTWCIDHLGCHDMGEGIPSDYYDLIWVGSVFTHLPQHKAVSLIANLKASLRPFGILIYTTHGRVTTANLEASNEDSQPNRYGSIMKALGDLSIPITAPGLVTVITLTRRIMESPQASRVGLSIARRMSAHCCYLLRSEAGILIKTSYRSCGHQPMSRA
jgi:SAM-dependent methyltransferase